MSSEIDKAYQQTLKNIDAYIQAVQAGLRAAGEAEIAQSKEMAEQAWRQVAAQEQFLRLVEGPANNLIREYTIPGLWDKVPPRFQQQKLEQISGLIQKAESGDKVAQAVLLRSKAILAEKKIKPQGLPNLEWKDPSALPRK